MFVMDSTTQLKVDIITKVAEGKISLNNAAKLLNKSKRTIERYLCKYSEVVFNLLSIKKVHRLQQFAVLYFPCQRVPDCR